LRLFISTIIILISISSTKADTIYNIIKIPNLEIYKIDNSNGLKYLRATKPFQVGIRNDNVTCFNSDIKNIEKKFQLIQKNLNIYQPNFLKKINLKYIVLCENLSVSEIDAAGVPNFKMKTLIIDINFNKKYFERIVHHEVFHIINDSFKDYFNEKEWNSYNPKNFEYAECSTCSDRVNLSTIKKTNGFLTEYSMSTASEDMAEVFSFLVYDKKKVDEKLINDAILKNKTSFIKNNILKISNNFSFSK
tara:strand:+ start:885 stop:1628 length:744 start_codon:yes stop_codon:yes gene_type:complete